MTANNDHRYHLRSLFSRSKLIAIDTLSKPSAKPSEKTVFQNVIRSNLILSSVGMTSPCRPRPYGICSTRQIHDMRARAFRFVSSEIKPKRAKVREKMGRETYTCEYNQPIIHPKRPHHEPSHIHPQRHHRQSDKVERPDHTDDPPGVAGVDIFRREVRDGWGRGGHTRRDGTVCLHSRGRGCGGEEEGVEK